MYVSFNGTTNTSTTYIATNNNATNTNIDADIDGDGNHYVAYPTTSNRRLKVQYVLNILEIAVVKLDILGRIVAQTTLAYQVLFPSLHIIAGKYDSCIKK